jgi:hypothetical protein
MLPLAYVRCVQGVSQPVFTITTRSSCTRVQSGKPSLTHEFLIVLGTCMYFGVVENPYLHLASLWEFPGRANGARSRWISYAVSLIMNLSWSDEALALL